MKFQSLFGKVQQFVNKKLIPNSKFLIHNYIDISPLVTFRMVFGALMLIGTIRFVLNGWIEKLYTEPTFFFQYYGFDWVQPLDEAGMYLLFYTQLVYITRYMYWQGI